MLYGLLSCLVIAFTMSGCGRSDSSSRTAALSAGDALAPTQWSGSIEVPLLAGTARVGTVAASVEGEQIVVRYTIAAPWQMVESYLDIETDPERIPQAPGNHKPILPHFAFHTTHAPGVTSFQYQRDIFWAPGSRVFIAANARVISGATCASAWGDGVPFATGENGAKCKERDDNGNDKGDGGKKACAAGDEAGDHGQPVAAGGDGSDDDEDDEPGACGGGRERAATYFSFVPLGIAALGQGTGWQLTRVGGVADGTDRTFQADLLMLQSGGGLDGAPLPADIEADFSSDADFASSEYILDESIMNAIEESERIGQLTPELQAIAEPADPPDATAAPTGFKLFGKCKDKDSTTTKKLDLASPIDLGKPKDLGGGFSGALSIAGNIQGSAEADLHLKLKRYAVFGFCVPYGVKFVDFHGFGSALVNYGATLNGVVSFDSSELKHPILDVELIHPTLFKVTFFIGPIPVIIKVSLPISIGLDLKASLQGSITSNSAQTSLGTFDYTCTFSGCNGTSSFHQTGAPSSQPITGSVSGHVQPEPWAEVALRAALYADDIAYLQLGVRPYLLGDLWGFFGNDCGDANADGVFETVSGLTFDLDWQLHVNARAAFLKDPEKHPAKPKDLFKTSPFHLLFKDLIGSSAIQPMLVGPSSAPVNVGQTYLGKMRPCWPYDDKVSYDLAWGDGASSPASEDPGTFFSAGHTWTSAGTRTLALTALRDDHGRTLAETTRRDVDITAPSGGTGGSWTPFLNRDVPSGNGDFETLADFLAAGLACANPTAIECQTVNGVDFKAAGQVYTCDPTVGGVCQNANQPNGQCLDYQVRFFCP